MTAEESVNAREELVHRKIAHHRSGNSFNTAKTTWLGVHFNICLFITSFIVIATFNSVITYFPHLAAALLSTVKCYRSYCNVLCCLHLK